jgi:signal transduction histidine kinase/ActR/RegA family two-component response regulator
VESEYDVPNLVREVERLRAREHRLDRLRVLTNELAHTRSLEQMVAAVVEHGVPAVGATSATIWLGEGPLASSPLSDAIFHGKPVFIESSESHRERYPGADGESVGTGSVACLPLLAGVLPIGAITFAFGGPRSFDEEERGFLDLIAAHAAQALLRAKTNDLELRSRAEKGLLYELLERVIAADTFEEVYDAALDCVSQALGVERAAILLSDSEGVLRFRAWRGLSDEYRAHAEGPSPWPRDASDPEPIVVTDVERDPTVSAFRELLRTEHIRALGFLPLVHDRQRLLGEVAIYSDVPRELGLEEIRLGETIAALVAQAIAQRLIEAEMLRARAEAERASRMKDEFLAVVSHELRTPLAAIVGWAAILKGSRKNDAEAVAKGVEVIERNAQAQSKIIEDILDVSRIVAGNLVLDPRPVSLVTIISEALESVRLSAGAKEIHVEFDSGEDLHSVVGDPERLRQIVWNLLSNAVKFTPAKGRVQVRLVRTPGTAAIQVSDTGRGIEPYFLPHVFERFWQADASLTRRHGGLGLGLAIVRHLTELHGGQASVESAGMGQGSTFTVTFPVKAVSTTRPARSDSSVEAATEGDADLTGIRVLLVDDEADAREVVGEVLVSFGAEVATVDSAEGALATVSGFAPTVMLSDIGMPEQDGFTLLRRLREMGPPYDELPVIALTAYARADDERRILAAGFHHFLAKPTDSRVLTRAVFDAARRE